MFFQTLVINTLVIIDYSFAFYFVCSGKILYMDIEGIHDGRRNHYTTEACRSLTTELWELDSGGIAIVCLISG